MKSGVHDVLEMPFKMSISSRGFATCNVSLSVSICQSSAHQLFNSHSISFAFRTTTRRRRRTEGKAMKGKKMGEEPMKSNNERRS